VLIPHEGCQLLVVGLGRMGIFSFSDKHVVITNPIYRQDLGTCMSTFVIKRKNNNRFKCVVETTSCMHSNTSNGLHLLLFVEEH